MIVKRRIRFTILIGGQLGNARAATVAYVVLRFDSSAARAKSPAVGWVGFATDEASLIR